MDYQDPNENNHKKMTRKIFQSPEQINELTQESEFQQSRPQLVNKEQK